MLAGCEFAGSSDQRQLRTSSTLKWEWFGVNPNSRKGKLSVWDFKKFYWGRWEPEGETPTFLPLCRSPPPPQWRRNGRFYWSEPETLTGPSSTSRWDHWAWKPYSSASFYFSPPTPPCARSLRTGSVTLFALSLGFPRNRP